MTQKSDSEMSDLSNKDFKAVSIKIFQYTIISMFETNEKKKRVSTKKLKIERKTKEKFDK